MGTGLKRALLPLGVAALGLLVCAGPAFGASKKVTLRGTVLVRHADVFSKGIAKYWYTLETTHGPVKLELRGRSAEGLGRMRVQVRGTKAGSTVRVAPGGLKILSGRRLSGRAQAASAPRLAVILFNFQNNQAQPYSVAQANGIYFTNPDSMAAYYHEESFGQTTVSGDILGWYTIPYSSASSCSTGTWANAALDAAQAAGHNLNQYSNFQFVFPSTASCGWAGLAYTPGPYSWINGSMVLRVISHEFGHNLGVHHASSLSCTSGGARVALSSTCSSSEYGDPFDVMGTGQTAQMNNFHKGQYGWFGNNIVNATASGTYTVTPLEQAGGTPIVRVPRSGTGTYFYLEFRQPFGLFDSFSPSAPVVNGVTIRIAPDFSEIVQSQLVDTTPNTGSYTDAPLAVGQSVTDPVSNVSFTTTSVSPGGATIQVQIGGVPPPPPPPPPTATKYVVNASSASPAAGTGVTITAQLATSGGTPVATSGKTVTWSKTGSGGSFGSPTSATNASGIASVTFTTGTAAGATYTVTATDTTSLTGTSGAFTTVPGPVSAAASTISAAPALLFADGSSSATVTVQAKDANGNNLTGSGGTVTLASSRGTLSAVTNNNSGSYTATLTSSTSPGPASITGTIGGSPIGGSATVTFVPVPTKYVVTPTSSGPVAGSAVTVNAQLSDSTGTPVAVAGRSVTWSTTGAGGSFGSSTSTTNASGIASVSFITGTAAGTTYTVTATDSSSLTGTSGTITSVPGPAAHLRFTSAAGDLSSGGTRELTVRLEDSNDNFVAGDSGRTITFTKTSGAGSVDGLGPTQTSGGTASETVTGALAGDVTVTASAPGLGSTATSFDVVAGAATHLVFTSATIPLASGSTRALTVELRDGNDNIAGSGGSVTFSKTAGAGTVAGLGTATPSGGIAAETVTGQTAGPITISASGDGLSATTTFTVVPGPASASTTTISASPGSAAADGSSLSTIAVQAKDANGNNLTSSGGPVTLTTSAGTLSAVTDNGNGTYSATLTSPSSPGHAVIGGTIAGGAIGHQATVTFVAQCVVPNVRGMTLAAARGALRRAHCTAGTVRRAASRTVRAGRVISQQPGNGRRLPAGSAVKLVLSTGPRRG